MTTQQPIRIGLIGANIHQGWSPRAHLPALATHPQFDLAAVCTSRQESADEAMAAFNAGSAWNDYNRMLADADIEAATISLRVPRHYEPTMVSLRSGKHTFTEWPLGRTTAEAIEMAEEARQQGVRTAVGLQARANPAIVHLRNLVADGYVGRVMTCHVRLMREGVLSRDSGRMWQRDDELGAHTLTIACGHTIDALCSVVGEFADVATVVSTQTTTWREADTGQDLPVTSPDNVLVSGNLQGGGVALGADWQHRLGWQRLPDGNLRRRGHSGGGFGGFTPAAAGEHPRSSGREQRSAGPDAAGGTTSCAGNTRRSGLQRGPVVQPVRSVNPGNGQRRTRGSRLRPCRGTCIDLSMPSDGPATKDAGWRWREATRKKGAHRLERLRWRQ